METIDLYSAIAEMRKRTAKKKPFSFSHFTWDDHRQKTNGLREVKRALLRPAAKGDDLSEADNKLFYMDLEMERPRVCWQPLIAYYMGKKVVLN